MAFPGELPAKQRASMVNYLVCVDASQGSRCALDLLVKIVRSEDKVLVLTCHEDPLVRFPTLYGSENSDPMFALPQVDLKQLQSLQQFAQDILNKSKEYLNSKQVACKSIQYLFVQEHGDVRQAILHQIKKNEIDVTIMGSRGRGTLKSVILGSVSTYIVQHSPSSVLVARGDVH